MSGSHSHVVGSEPSVFLCEVVSDLLPVTKATPKDTWLWQTAGMALRVEETRERVVQTLLLIKVLSDP